MLSIEDIYREIGKNIFICPIDTNNFRDNSIDLTASSFAWTNDGKYIYDETTNKITVPPRETACILTNESIYVSAKIGGTYHSRVSLVKMGFGHISTTLDPKYCGQSLIVLHNCTDKALTLNKGDRIVSLMFYYLSTPICEEILSTPPSHIDKISKLDTNGLYSAWKDSNPWATNAALLQAHFKEQYLAAFIEKRKIYAQHVPISSKIWSSVIGRIVIKYIVVVAILGLAYYVVNKHFTPKDASGWATLIISSTICIIGLVAGDLSNKKR